MVIKILPRSRERRNKLGPRVCLPKLEYSSYSVEPSSSFQSVSYGCQKEEIPCFFQSEVDLNDNENNGIIERNIACQCGYCLSLYDHKNQDRENFLAQQGANSPRNPPVDEILPFPDVGRVLPPQPAFATNAGTQTEQKVYRFTCKDCSSQFNDEYFFELHNKRHRKAFECAFCDARFLSEKTLLAHTLLHLREPVYECVYCNAIYNKKKFLNEHLKCHEKYSFNCQTCSARFESTVLLELHKKSHSSSGKLVHVFRKLKAVQLPPCDEGDGLERVTSVPLQKNPLSSKFNDFFDCGKCGLKFKHERLLKKHNQIHTRKSSRYLHVCTKCDARFKLNGHLLFHVKAAHKQTGKRKK